MTSSRLYSSWNTYSKPYLEDDHKTGPGSADAACTLSPQANTAPFKEFFKLRRRGGGEKQRTKGLHLALHLAVVCHNETNHKQNPQETVALEKNQRAAWNVHGTCWLITREAFQGRESADAPSMPVHCLTVFNFNQVSMNNWRLLMWSPRAPQREGSL